MPICNSALQGNFFLFDRKNSRNESCLVTFTIYFLGEGKAKLDLPESLKNGFGMPLGTSKEIIREMPLHDEDDVNVGYVSVTLHLTSITTQINNSDGDINDFRLSNDSKNNTQVTDSFKPKFAVGDVVEGRYKGESVWYSAIIKSYNRIVSVDNHCIIGNGNSGENNRYTYTYHLSYDDGDEELSLVENDVRLQQVAILDTSFSIGENVEALFGRGEEWYSAKISSIASSGNYNLYYEDGDEEDDVSIGRIRGLPSNLSTSISINSDNTYDNDVNDNQFQTEITPRGDSSTEQEDLFQISMEDPGCKQGSVKMLKLDDSIGSPSSLQRRPSVLKSSEEAFLTNYLDELSDDDDDNALGDLNGGPAVYGHVESRDIQNETEEENSKSANNLARNGANGELQASTMETSKSNFDDKNGNNIETNQSSFQPIVSVSGGGIVEKDEENAGCYEEDFDA